MLMEVIINDMIIFFLLKYILDSVFLTHEIVD
jgi:hypothetical protein